MKSLSPKSKSGQTGTLRWVGKRHPTTLKDQKSGTPACRSDLPPFPSPSVKCQKSIPAVLPKAHKVRCDAPNQCRGVLLTKKPCSTDHQSPRIAVDELTIHRVERPIEGHGSCEPRGRRNLTGILGDDAVGGTSSVSHLDGVPGGINRYPSPSPPLRDHSFHS